MNNTIVFEHSFWFFFICIALAFGYAFLLYFRDKKLSELTKNKIRLLAVLRFFSTLIISFLLLSPLLKSIERTIEKPVIIFAIDNSESIKLANKDNGTEIKNSVENIINEVSKDFDVQSFSFGANLSDSLPFDFSEKQTDISNIISEISNKFYNKNIGALIIVSDGIYNQGTNPSFNILNTNYQIFTVALGDTTEYKDLQVKDVEYNEIAYLNSRFPIQVTISAKKIKNTEAVCKIYHKGKVIASKNFRITSDNYIEKQIFDIEALNAGVQQYTISLSQISGERNTENNSKTVAINVIENKQKILILANSPHPDIGAIRNSLKQNKNYEVDVFSTDDFNGKVSDYSLIVIHQLPSASNSISTIYPEIIKAKIPMLFVMGTQTDYKKFNSLKLGLNVYQQNRSFDDAEYYVNPNFSDFEISDNFKEILNSAPPAIVPFGNYTMSAQMKPVLLQKVKNIKTSNPLIIISRQNTTDAAVGFIMGENIWRLRMQTFKKNNDFAEFDNFIFQLVQSLVVKTDKNRFIVKVDRIIPENKEVVFKAEVYDKIYELTNKEDVLLKITDSTGNSFDYTMTRTTKAYNLNIGNMPIGEYSYFAETKDGDEKLKASGKFVVVKSNVEAQNLVANHKTLFEISSKTGGRFIMPQNIDSLPVFLKESPNIVSVSYENQDLSEFIKLKWIFFLILSILTVEWFLRKFFGTY